MFMTRVFFLPFFSQDISTGFSESGCKTLSLLSSPFAQFHFKAITRNNHGFIPCKTSSRPKTSCPFSIKSGSQQTKEIKRKTILVLFQHLASGERKTHNMVELLSDTLCYLTHYTSFIWGDKVAPLLLSFPERFLFRQAPEMTQKQRPIKENKSRDRKTFFVLCVHVCGWFRRQTGCWVLQKECPRAIQSYCLTINGHHPYKLQNVQTKKDEFVHVCKILSELLQKEI